MPDIHFECPKCKQPMDAPQELVAQLIECPTCKETIEVPVHSQHKDPPKPPEPAPKPAPSPARAPETKQTDFGKSGTRPVSMKVTNLLLAGMMLALIFIGIRPIVFPPPVAPPASPVKWEYMVEACDDDCTEMREYARTHPDTSALDFDNEFSLLKVKPSGKDSETDWELCAWFLEPKAHPKLILIFKRPV